MNKAPASDLKLERKSSIESEPQTLSLDQLQYAREAALYVLNTKTLEEAISIFTDGLQPVLGISKGYMNMDLGDDAEKLDCLAVDHVNLQMLAGLRDIVTAPF